MIDLSQLNTQEIETILKDFLRVTIRAPHLEVSWHDSSNKDAAENVLLVLPLGELLRESIKRANEIVSHEHSSFLGEAELGHLYAGAAMLEHFASEYRRLIRGLTANRWTGDTRPRNVEYENWNGEPPQGPPTPMP